MAASEQVEVASGRSRAAAVLSQLSFFGCQILLVAVIRFSLGREDPFVRAWSTEALNLQLVWIVPWLAMIGVASVAGIDALFWVAVAYFDVVALYAIAMGVVGATKAWRREVWRYPLNLRLIDG